MTEMRGEGNVDAGGAIQGSSISGRGRVVIGGRVYSSQGGAPRYGAQRPGSESETTTEPETTSMGQEVEHAIEIYESVPLEGDIRQYDLRIDGVLVWSGAGDDRVDALLDAIAAATGQSEEPPDN
jgi:hypothetical protein